jgi:1-acyl-sn-glycerol-3-phosphate acyltransferase
VIAAIFIAIARALFRIRVDGIENIPADGGAVIVANHVSAFDGVVLGVVVWWKRRRLVRAVTAAEFFEKPVFGSALRAFRQIPIRRGEGDSAAIDGATDAVRAGSLVGIVPEGRVNPDPDRLQEGRSGAARIALASDGRIVPAAIWGTQERWPKSGMRWTRPLRPVAAFTFGTPVSLEGDGSYEDARAATTVVMAAIEEQVGRARALAER